MAKVDKDSVTGYHFSSGKLNFGDGREVVEGVMHSASGTIVPCGNGMHSAPTPGMAYNYYGHGQSTERDPLVISKVVLVGDIQNHMSYWRGSGSDRVTKHVARHRYYKKVVKLSRTHRRAIRKLWENRQYADFDVYMKALVG